MNLVSIYICNENKYIKENILMILIKNYESFNLTYLSQLFIICSDKSKEIRDYANQLI